MITVIDDHLVLRWLLGRAADLDGPITTTTHWWWRLSVALRRRAGGELSRPVLALAPGEQLAMVASVDDIGVAFEVTDFTDVLPVAADIATAHPVNLLAAEALAVCLVDGGRLAVGVHNPPLAQAAAALSVPYEVVSSP